MAENVIPSPARIMKHLNSFVIGQEEAKKTLSVAVYNHYRRQQLSDGPDAGKWQNGKSNVLLIGNTGCGKTHLINTIARMLNVPFYVQDCTKITASGYVGSDVEDCLAGLLRSCNYDVEAAQRGIVMLDECDKLRKAYAGASITRDVSGECVQQSLLKIVEGDVVGVQPQGGRKHPEASLVYVDTTNILFIASGAFVGLEEIIRKRTGQSKGAIGFNGSGQKKEETESTVLDRILPEDLTRYGMIPEFIGRFPVITNVEPLSKDDLVRILTEPDDAITRQYRRMMAMDGADLKFTDGALEAIATLALEIGTGARALRSVIEKVMLDIMYEVPSCRDKNRGRLTEYVITQEMVYAKTRQYQQVV